MKRLTKKDVVVFNTAAIPLGTMVRVSKPGTDLKEPSSITGMVTEVDYARIGVVAPVKGKPRGEYHAWGVWNFLPNVVENPYTLEVFEGDWKVQPIDGVVGK